MRDRAIDPAFHPGTPEYDEILQQQRELRESRAYDLQTMQEDYDCNHSYVARRPGR
mgnify:FL=1